MRGVESGNSWWVGTAGSKAGRTSAMMSNHEVSDAMGSRWRQGGRCTEKGGVGSIKEPLLPAAAKGGQTEGVEKAEMFDSLT